MGGMSYLFLYLTSIYPTSLQQHRVFSYGITLGTMIGRSNQWGWGNGKCEGRNNGTRTVQGV